MFVNEYANHGDLRKEERTPIIQHYSLSIIQRRRARVRGILEAYLGLTLVPEVIGAVSGEISAYLKIDSDPVFGTLAFYRGMDITEGTMDLVSAVCAGNVNLMSQGQFIPRWAPEYQIDEWSLSTITDVRNHGQTFEMDVEMYTGRPAGRSFTYVRKRGREMMMARDLGLTWKDAELFYPQELTQMRGFALLTAPRDGGKEPAILSWHVTPTHAKWNKGLYRTRVDVTCPNNWKPKPYKGCFECPMGYGPAGRKLVIRGSSQPARCDFGVRKGTLYDDLAGETEG